MMKLVFIDFLVFLIGFLCVLFRFWLGGVDFTNRSFEFGLAYFVSLSTAISFFVFIKQAGIINEKITN